MTTRQYARLVRQWIASIGLDPTFFGTPSLRRTKATLIYRRTGNLRAVQLLLGHKKIESTVPVNRIHSGLIRVPRMRPAAAPVIAAACHPLSAARANT
jgi:integrase